MDREGFVSLGITGNIGSGKSYVARLISLFRIPVFDCDKEAKLLYTSSDELKTAMIDRYGSDIYDKKGCINRSMLSDIIFSNDEELLFINSTIHPIIERKCSCWMDEMYVLGYNRVLVECAIMFETNIHTLLDKIILVDAPLEVKIKRAMERDNSTYGSVLSRMEKQMDHKDLKSKSDFVINNSGKNLILPQISFILENL